MANPQRPRHQRKQGRVSEPRFTILPIESIWRTTRRLKNLKPNYGPAAGRAVVTVVTKKKRVFYQPGFKGPFFEFFRKQRLDLRANYFDKHDFAAGKPFHNNQLAGSLEGHHPRTKQTFFFHRYEGLP